MKVFAIASALLFVCSTAAAIANPAGPAGDEALMARDASPEANPGWWGFRWSRRGHGGWKRDASAAPEPWWRWSRRGQGGWKRDVTDADKTDDDDFIYLPDSMTPDDLAQMLQYTGEEPAAE